MCVRVCVRVSVRGLPLSLTCVLHTIISNYCSVMWFTMNKPVLVIYCISTTNHNDNRFTRRRSSKISTETKQGF